MTVLTFEDIEEFVSIINNTESTFDDVLALMFQDENLTIDDLSTETLNHIYDRITRCNICGLWHHAKDVGVNTVNIICETCKS